MITIRFTTWVNAPVERCFLLATHADLSSVQDQTSNRAASQSTLQLGDRISWQIGIQGARRSYFSRVEAIRPYTYFRDGMSEGIFRRFEHNHHFARMDDGTRVRDEIQFSTRLGPLGRMLEGTVLRVSLMKMLAEQHALLKRIAESEEWRRYVGAKVGAEEDVHETIRIPEPVTRVTNRQRFA